MVDFKFIHQMNEVNGNQMHRMIKNDAQKQTKKRMMFSSTVDLVISLTPLVWK